MPLIMALSDPIIVLDFGRKIAEGNIKKADNVRTMDDKQRRRAAPP